MCTCGYIIILQKRAYELNILNSKSNKLNSNLDECNPQAELVSFSFLCNSPTYVIIHVQCSYIVMYMYT